MRPRRIEGSAFRVLVDSLRNNTTLTYLDLHTNPIGKKGVTALSEVLKTNMILTCLNLHLNNIEDKGALILSEALKVNATLAALVLTNNSIGNEGAFAFSEILKTNTTLITLDLRFNLIKKGVLVLLNALKASSTLTSLGFWNTFLMEQLSGGGVLKRLPIWERRVSRTFGGTQGQHDLDQFGIGEQVCWERRGPGTVRGQNQHNFNHVGLVEEQN
ncbi:hypothetical protein BCR41DRAFT_167906 [Lobosporangium transversale]|uniref:Uncharacterized protein n=1 Tax=Lobosporangium transversale TaxID=64571 RepID=A0A1Y2GDS7_9FUNG|nr:hypothetical protein BCR41DRAFT_167906 [Lobosporangium transversale]ORZ06587.1 hypothetical protein BCR41DRAFT_167906 [Lobosporangium transversale]|eukprot:XP_021877630.1 hypothetical protein BCR41DRAFT_167906 [Lobosporangium transversale]